MSPRKLIEWALALSVVIVCFLAVFAIAQDSTWLASTDSAPFLGSCNKLHFSLSRRSSRHFYFSSSVQQRNLAIQSVGRQLLGTVWANSLVGRYVLGGFSRFV